MKCLLILLPFLSPADLSYAEMKLGPRSTAAFASVDEGKRVLMTRDDFVQRLSPFDLQSRMKTDRPVSEEAFLAFVGQNVLAWNDEEKGKLEDAIKEIQLRLEALSLLFPKTVYLVKTAGKEEGGAAYTRGEAVVLPQVELAKRPQVVARVICHELFHILSRSNPQLRERLYAAIGFEKCDEVEFPPDLKARKITNPDGLRNDHCIRIQAAGKPAWAVPILFSRTEKYDVARGGEFFDYLVFRFLLVERSGNSGDVRPGPDAAIPRLVDPRAVTGFYEQVGKNTGYTIHPDEILADNFVHLVFGAEKVPSPEVLKKIRGVLAKKATDEPIPPVRH